MMEKRYYSLWYWNGFYVKLVSDRYIDTRTGVGIKLLALEGGLIGPPPTIPETKKVKERPFW